jgi:hypothetical protein
MGFVRRRLLYFVSIALGLCAIVIGVRSQQIVATGIVGIAHATQAVHEGAAKDVVEAMNHHATAQVNRGTGLATAGFVVAFASVLCFFFSRRRAEPGPRIVPVIVWMVYFFFSLLTV